MCPSVEGVLHALQKPKNALDLFLISGWKRGFKHYTYAQVPQLSKALMWKRREQKEIWKLALG